MLATGVGVRDDVPAERSAPPPTFAPTTTAATAALATVSTVPRAPSTTTSTVAAPADVACSAVAAIAQLRPVHTRLSSTVRAASARPDDGALVAQALSRIDEYRALHLPRFAAALDQLAAAEPDLGAAAERLGAFVDAGIRALDLPTDGATLAAAARQIVESPDLGGAVDSLVAIGRYGTDACGIAA